MMNSMAAVILAASLATAMPVQPESGGARGLKMSTTRVVTELAATPIPAAATRSASPRLAPRRSTGTQILGGVLGGAAGFFAGIFIGGAIENGFSPCGCDDPGLKGAVIGAPIGAVAGAIIGSLLGRR